MKKRPLRTILTVVLVATMMTPVRGWSRFGNMAVKYVAYQKLTAATTVASRGGGGAGAVQVGVGTSGDSGVLRAQYYPMPPPNACCTPYAPCPLSQPAPAGAPCYCPSPYGPIRGYACRL